MWGLMWLFGGLNVIICESLIICGLSYILGVTIIFFVLSL